MKCTEVDSILEMYAAGELEPERRSQADTHLGECASCAVGLAQARKLEALLARVVCPQMPESFFDRQSAAIFARLSSELDWHAPKLSLLMLAVVLLGYVGGSMAPLMDWVHDARTHSQSAMAGLDGVLPLYGLLLLLAVFSFSRESEPAFVEAAK